MKTGRIRMKFRDKKTDRSALSLSRTLPPETPEATLNPKQIGTVGRAGEDAAAEYVLSEGLDIIARNVRYGHREIDMICCDDEHIVFVEVKSRTRPEHTGSGRYGPPSSAMDQEKRQNLLSAARYWLTAHPHPGLYPRMDVIEVLLKKNPESGKDTGENREDAFSILSVNHIKNAFGVNF
ncbi:MAG: YraN family protein [Clostridiales bacterium]|nr:YraN family protein [Clostridiales bacterium]